MDKAYLTKWKEHTLHITFTNFSWSRIEKDDIIPINVIGTALNKPNLPYIIFEKSTLTLIGSPGLTLLLKIDNVLSLWLNLEQVPIFWELRIKDLHLHNRWEISLPFKNWHISNIVVFIGKLKQRIYNRRRDLVNKFQLQGFVNFSGVCWRSSFFLKAP